MGLGRFSSSIYLATHSLYLPVTSCCDQPSKKYLQADSKASDLTIYPLQFGGIVSLGTTQQVSLLLFPCHITATVEVDLEVPTRAGAMKANACWYHHYFCPWKVLDIQMSPSIIVRNEAHTFVEPITDTSSKTTLRNAHLLQHFHSPSRNILWGDWQAYGHFSPLTFSSHLYSYSFAFLIKHSFLSLGSLLPTEVAVYL